MGYKTIRNCIAISALILCPYVTTIAAETETSLVGIKSKGYLTCVVNEETETESETELETEEPLATQYEKDLIAIVTMGEAEGESEEGKRLVIDTILNRVDSEYFPDTIEEVIYQPDQFEAMWNGRVNKVYDMTGIYEMIDEELEERMNSDVIFFTAGHYGYYGTPLFQVGNHYFSTYE